MQKIRIDWRNEVEDYLFITLGLLLYAVGWTVFLLPYEIPSGGLTGVSALIYYVTGLEMQVTYLIGNVFLLLCAMKILGLKFCLKTIYAVLMLTFFLWGMQRLLLAQEGEGATHLPRYLWHGFGSVFLASRQHRWCGYYCSSGEQVPSCELGPYVALCGYFHC